MDPPRVIQEGGQGSTRNNGANPSYEATMAKMMEFIERQGEIIEKMRQGGERADKGVDSNDRALERFLKFHPPRFGGKIDEEEAEKWMEAMSDIYATLQYEDNRKVKFAVFQLEGPAKAWWRLVEQKWEQTSVPWTWIAFLGEFKAKFIPMVVRNRKEEEFMYLKQRTLTVSQYEATFTKLAKYAPELVNTEEKRRRRFLHGLNVEIQNALITARVTTYADAVEFAQMIEDGQARLRDFQNSRRTASRDMPATKEKGSQGPSTVPPKEIRGVKRLATVDKRPGKKKGTPPVVCQFCGKPNHTEAECWRKARKCFRCGSADHHYQRCPLQTRPSSSAL